MQHFHCPVIRVPFMLKTCERDQEYKCSFTWAWFPPTMGPNWLEISPKPMNWAVLNTGESNANTNTFILLYWYSQVNVYEILNINIVMEIRISYCSTNYFWWNILLQFPFYCLLIILCSVWWRSLKNSILKINKFWWLTLGEKNELLVWSVFVKSGT